MSQATEHPITLPASAQPTPTRRHLLAGLSGAALAGTALAIAGPGASVAEHPDAELLAACAEYERLEAEYRASCEGDENADLECPDGYNEAWSAVVDLPAQTAEGMRAKAQAIIAYHTPDFDSGDNLMWSLVRDVADWGVAP